VIRFVNISVFALVMAGFASAGGIDPAVNSNYSSPDGALFSSATLPSSSWSFAGGFGGNTPQAIQANTTQFQWADIASINGGSSANAAGCPYSNAFQSGGPATCDVSLVSDFNFSTPGSGSGSNLYTLDFTLSGGPKTIYGFDLFLAETAASQNFGISNVSFYDGTAVPANLVSSQAVDPFYSDYPGASNRLEITDAFSAGLSVSEVSFQFTSATSLTPRIWSIQSIDSPVPEPGTWMLAGLGMLGLMAATKMRNRRLQSNL